MDEDENLENMTIHQLLNEGSKMIEETLNDMTTASEKDGAAAIIATVKAVWSILRVQAIHQAILETVAEGYH